MMNAGQPSNDPSSDPANLKDPFPAASPEVPTRPNVPRRRWLPMVGLSLLGAVLGAAVVLAAMMIWVARQGERAAENTPKYTARYLLRVAMQEQPLVFPKMDRKSSGDFDVYKRTQAELVKSRAVLTAALRSPKIAGLPIIRQQADAIGWLAGELRVDFPSDAEIMEVSLGGDEPEEVAALLNAVVDAYVTHVVEAEQRQRTERLRLLEEVYAEKLAEVRKKRNELKSLVGSLGTDYSLAPGLKQQFALQEYAERRRELTSVRMELRQVEGERKIQQAQLSGSAEIEISEADLDAFVQSDAVAGQLLYQLSQLGQQLGNIEATATVPARAQYMEKLQRDLKALREQLDIQRTVLREELQARKRAALAADVRRLQTRIAVLSEQKEEIEKDLEQERGQIEQIGTSSIDIEMRAELEQLVKVLAGIAEEREMLKVELRSAPRITPLQKAEVPAGQTSSTVSLGS